MREAYQQAQNDKSQVENELNQKMLTQKKIFENEIEKLTNKMNMAEESKKEIQRQQVGAESEFDKQKALLDQKIEFLEKNLEESNRREKEISIELKNCKRDYLT